MQPKSLWSLGICAIVVVATFVVGICFDFHLLDKNILWSIIKNGGVLGALVFAAIHYFSSRPKVFSFSRADWIESGESWSEVFVVVPKSKHGRGDNPTVQFQRIGGFSHEDNGLVFKIEENGDIRVCHSPNRFMPPWKDFTIKITK